MKKETMQLLQKIHKFMKSGKAIFLENEINDFEVFCKKIETIEEDLRNGGYIPDKDNKPCKAGDKIIYEDCGEQKEGVLVWDNYARCFTYNHDENINEKLDEMDFWKL